MTREALKYVRAFLRLASEIKRVLDRVLSIRDECNCQVKEFIVRQGFRDKYKLENRMRSISQSLLGCV
jgi:hypothetical protein